MTQRIATFLMFDGNAEEAMTFYVSLFANSEILHIERYGPGEMGAEGSVMHARFVLDSQQFTCIDSNVQHAFGFTPSMSLMIDCASDDEIATLYANLSEGGEVLMALDAYPFSQRFGWVADRYGVSWQLNLPYPELADLPAVGRAA